MQLASTVRNRIHGMVWGTSGLAWVLLLFSPGHIKALEHCHVPATGASSGSLSLIPDMNPFPSQLAGWGLMVVAMMLPKLAMPIEHVCRQSLRRHRVPFSVLFVLGYICSWMVAGVAMTAWIVAISLWYPLSYWPAAVFAAIAAVWECTPAKQRFLNRGHEHPCLPAFGWAAAGSVARFGVMHGAWCIGSGWALMLFPMLMPQGHNAAMLLVTFIMLNEHLENPRFPRWSVKPRLRLVKYLLARSVMWWQKRHAAFVSSQYGSVAKSGLG